MNDVSEYLIYKICGVCREYLEQCICDEEE